jgi:glycosyltransferase involved in cell wall biosynthesis
MGNRTVFLYANQPVIRYDGRYYARFKSFLDFLVELSKQDDIYRLVVPCKVVKHLPEENLVPINLPINRVIEVSNYTEQGQSIISSFLSTPCIRSQVLFALNEKGKVTFAGAGPSSFLFWLSLFVPRSVRFAFFIRGDTLKTVQNCYSGNMMYYPSTGVIKLFHKRILSLVLHSRAKVFVFGKKLKSLYPVPESNIHVITPLIEEAIIRKDTRPNIMKDRPLRVLYVGRLSKEKNLFSLIEACKLALKVGRSFALSIVGLGPLEIEIRKLIAESGLSNQIKFIGYIPHGDALIAEFDSHDLLCLPSFTEGTPSVVIEAFARGMPVLATPVGSLPSLFPDEIKFIDGFSADNILQGINWCNMRREELSDMGRKGQMSIHRFLLKENAVRVDKILRSSM